MKVLIDTNIVLDIARNGCDALATRNKVDFGDRPNVLDPAELIESIKSSGT